jgi:hypothetical protein
MLVKDELERQATAHGYDVQKRYERVADGQGLVPTLVLSRLSIDASLPRRLSLAAIGWAVLAGCALWLFYKLVTLVA